MWSKSWPKSRASEEEVQLWSCLVGESLGLVVCGGGTGPSQTARVGGGGASLFNSFPTATTARHTQYFALYKALLPTHFGALHLV